MNLIKQTAILFFIVITSFQAPAQQTSLVKIVMFGNSITHQGKWEEVLGRKDVLNWGIPGYTTGQLICTTVFTNIPGSGYGDAAKRQWPKL